MRSCLDEGHIEAPFYKVLSYFDADEATADDGAGPGTAIHQSFDLIHIGESAQAPDQFMVDARDRRPHGHGSR